MVNYVATVISTIKWWFLTRTVSNSVRTLYTVQYRSVHCTQYSVQFTTYVCSVAWLFYLFDVQDPGAGGELQGPPLPERGDLCARGGQQQQQLHLLLPASLRGPVLRGGARHCHDVPEHLTLLTPRLPARTLSCILRQSFTVCLGPRETITCVYLAKTNKNLVFN